MSEQPSTWPKAIDRLLPHHLFELATKYPDITYVEYPRKNIADDYQKITYRQFANAVHSCAWWIEATVGKPQNDNGSETLVYMGPSDVRYAVLVLGSVVAGYKMLFPSPRYGAESITKLIETVDGKVMLIPENPLSVAADITSTRKMRTFTIPTVDELLNSTPIPHPYDKTYSQHSHEPLVCLHTSGTTGFPKPIIWTHLWASSVIQSFLLPPPTTPPTSNPTSPMFRSRWMYMYPPFHGSGLMGSIISPLGMGTITVYAPPASDPVSAVRAMADALDILGDEGSCNMLAAGPPTFEYLGSKQGASTLSRVSKRISTARWGGGDVSREAGEVVSKYMDISPLLASTEGGGWPVLRGQKENSKLQESWHYSIFHPAANLRFDALSIGQDEGTAPKLYEAVAVRNDGVKWGGWVQSIFLNKTYEHLQEARLGDLFTPHPQNPNMWKFAGRTDDMLNFITAEKFHPVAAEQRIAAHPGVAEVMWVGTGRPRGALIMRLEEGVTLDDIWEVVESVNESVPVYATVAREMVLLVREQFLQTAKGSVQKKGMLEKYGKEIDALYQ